jgi:hypothetical protein
MDEVDDNEQADQTERTKEEQNAYDAILEGKIKLETFPLFIDTLIFFIYFLFLFFTAKKYFIAAKDTLEKDGSLTPQSYSDLAETTLNEANLTSNPEEQTALYEEVVKCVNQARTLADGSEYILPEGLEIFLEEWNNNDKE